MDRAVAAKRSSLKKLAKLRRAAIPVWQGGVEQLEKRQLLSSSSVQDIVASSQALFIKNQGQWDDPSIYYALRTEAGSIVMTDHGPVFNVFQPTSSGTAHEQFSVTFDNANNVVPTGSDKATGVYNYLASGGNTSGVATYGKVNYNNLYDGISLVTWGKRANLKYEFHVAPGVDYKQAQISYDGIQGLSIDSNGRLHIKSNLGEMVDDAPIVYQMVNGKRVEIKSAFKLLDANTYTFELKGSYDASKELVLDPTLTFQTYLGGTAGDNGEGIAVDVDGNIYLTGQASSSDFPLKSAFDLERGGQNDAFVTKFDYSGKLLWSTYFGGSNSDGGQGIGVSADGNLVFVAGTTQSSDTTFPDTTGGPYAANAGSTDAFFTVLNSDGSLNWATYYGGSGGETVTRMIVDSDDNVYIIGATSSSNLPNTILGFQSKLAGNDGYIVKINTSPNSRSVLWATYLGGTADDVLAGAALNSTGDLFIVGDTTSTDLALNVGPDKNENRDVFVARITGTGTGGGFGAPSLVWTTYLGGNQNDTGGGIAVNSNNIIAITGQTSSTNFPVTTNAGTLISQNLPPAGKKTLSGQNDAFIATYELDGDNLFATYFGGNGTDIGRAIIVDPNDAFLMVGQSTSTDLPLKNPTGTDGGTDAQLTNRGNNDALYMVFTPATGTNGLPTIRITRLDLYGGNQADDGRAVAIDSVGGVLIAGTTQSTNLAQPDPPPIIVGKPFPPPPPVNAGGMDVFAIRFAFDNEAMPPTAPTDLIATLDGQFVRLAWGDTANNEEGFLIYRSGDGGSTYQFIDSTGANITSYLDDSVDPGKTYYYFVAAFNGYLAEATDPVKINTPSANIKAPSSLAATPISSTRIDLKWKDNADNETKYEAWRQETSDGVWQLIATLPAGATSYQDTTGLEASTEYAYRVRALNAVRASGYADPVVVSTKSASFITAPSGLQAARLNETSVKLLWQDNSNNEDHFVIERADFGSSNYATIGTVGPNVTTFIDTTVVLGKVYLYRVKATADSPAVNSAYSNVAASDINESLLKPTRVEAVALSSSQIKITWVDNALVETKYLIERAINQPNDWFVIGEAQTNATSYYDKRATSKKRYYYRVRATDGTNFSQYSDQATDRALPLFVTAPSAPSALRATIDGNDVKLKWKDNADDETSYVVERARALDGPFQKIADLGINARGYIDTTVASGTNYYYRVRAMNGGIRSVTSNIVRIRSAGVAPAKKKTSSVSVASVPPAPKPSASVFSVKPLPHHENISSLLSL